jgi:outer membrane lipoprotein carrier protein
LKKKAFLLFTLLGNSLIASTISGMKTFSADFEQKIVNDQQSRIIYKGKLFAKKQNNQALWIYTDPIDKKIYYSSCKVVIVEPELEQAIFAKLDKVPNILTLLHKAKRVGEGRYRTTFNGIDYTIIFKEGKLSEIRYRDELQNRVTIRFYNQKRDQPIADKKFVWKIPAEYDILEQK